MFDIENCVCILSTSFASVTHFLYSKSRIKRMKYMFFLCIYYFHLLLSCMKNVTHFSGVINILSVALLFIFCELSLTAVTVL
jgi:hypothetical protein